MTESEFDRHLAEWLRDGPSAASPRLLEAVADHARTHPRRGSVRARLSDAFDWPARRWPATVAIRPIILLALLVLSFALGGLVYASWQRSTVVVPLPSPTPSVTPAPASAVPASPTPTAPPGAYVCPPGTDPDRPGPLDQSRPRPEVHWRAAVDSQSGVLILTSEQSIWAFNLCTNTWRQSDTILIERDWQAYPVYDIDSDLTIFFGKRVVTGYDADSDTAARMSSTPLDGPWAAAYDPVTGLIVARHENTSRMWTYDIDTDTWQEIAQVGDIPPQRAGSEAQLLAYDASVDRLVLYVGGYSGTPARATYEFDLRSATWSWQEGAPPPAMAVSWYVTEPFSIAYDEVDARSVVYSRGRVNAYDAATHQWATVSDLPNVSSNALGVALAYDPANRRIVAVGGGATSQPLPAELAYAIDDVAAFDLQAHTWSQLLARTPGNALPSPSIGP